MISIYKELSSISWCIPLQNRNLLQKLCRYFIGTLQLNKHSICRKLINPISLMQLESKQWALNLEKYWCISWCRWCLYNMVSSYNTSILAEAFSEVDIKNKIALDSLVTHQVLFITSVHFKRWYHILHLNHDDIPTKSVLILSIYLISFSNILWQSDAIFVSSQPVLALDLGQYSITLLHHKFDPPGENSLVGIIILNCILSELIYI